MNDLDVILDDDLNTSDKRRRDLLPMWIKVFLWIFMVLGFIAPFGLVAGILGKPFNISLYGLETLNVFSILGLLLMALFTLKGCVSYGLWTEKRWAVKLAIVDAVVGIAICGIVMLVLPFLEDGFKISFKLELLALIPYLNKMRKIETEWSERSPG